MVPAKGWVPDCPCWVRNLWEASAIHVALSCCLCSSCGSLHWQCWDGWCAQAVHAIWASLEGVLNSKAEGVSWKFSPLLGAVGWSCIIPQPLEENRPRLTEAEAGSLRVCVSQRASSCMASLSTISCGISCVSRDCTMALAETLHLECRLEQGYCLSFFHGQLITFTAENKEIMAISRLAEYLWWHPSAHWIGYSAVILICTTKFP